MRDHLVRGVPLGLAALVVAAAILDRTGLATVELPRLDGHAPWVLSRASGFTAFSTARPDRFCDAIVTR